jgi:uncharacterized protein CbrC (UPF0167 family)
MTREQAITTMMETAVKNREWSETMIDAFARLGMLKLEEPKSEPDAMDLLINACRGVPYLATTINETVERAGLRIVKK